MNSDPSAATGLSNLQELRERGSYQPGAPQPGFDPSRTVLLVIDPVNDFLSEGGAAWEMTKSTVHAHNVVGHLRQANVTYLSDAIGAENMVAYEASVRVNYPLVSNAVLKVEEFVEALERPSAGGAVAAGDEVIGSDRGKIGAVDDVQAQPAEGVPFMTVSTGVLGIGGKLHIPLGAALRQPGLRQHPQAGGGQDAMARAAIGAGPPGQDGACRTLGCAALRLHGAHRRLVVAVAVHQVRATSVGCNHPACVSE